MSGNNRESRVASCEGRVPPPRRSRGGFTLIEVLAAMLLIAIVLPAVMGAITLSTRAASAAKSRTEAAMLANGKLSELVATDGWENGNLSGDFSPDWPKYKWQATVTDWATTDSGDDSGVTLSQIDLVVSWQGATKEESITVSTLARSAVNQ